MRAGDDMKELWDVPRDGFAGLYYSSGLAASHGGVLCLMVGCWAVAVRQLVRV